MQEKILRVTGTKLLRDSGNISYISCLTEYESIFPALALIDGFSGFIAGIGLVKNFVFIFYVSYKIA